MPDLGTYAVPVLGSYAATAVLLAILVLTSLRRAARVRTRLRKLEEAKGRANV